MLGISNYRPMSLDDYPDVVELVAPPVGATVLSLEEVKLHLRYDGEDEEDSLMLRILDAATRYVEAVCSMSILPRTIIVSMSGFSPRSDKHFPIAPLRSIEAVRYVNDADGLSTVVAPEDYRVRRTSTGAIILPAYNKSWPSARWDHGSVEFEAKVGYEPSADATPDYGINVPAQLKQAILLAVGDMYENRESQAVSTRIYSSMFDNRTFRRLIANFRMRRT